MIGSRLQIANYVHLLAVCLSVIISLDIATADTVETGFLDMLVGKWQGQAVQTPVGPVPYDIHFRKKDEDCISGTADNGFSNHTWTFCRHDTELVLNFLSDFRDNRQPIRLHAVSREEEKLVFHAASHPFMDVLIFPRKREIRVDVMHNNRLHVRIVWSRRLR